MPCFTANISEKGQPLLRVWVTDAAVDVGAVGDLLRPVNADALDEIGVKVCCALLDTGANRSCITERLASKMKLTIQGKDDFSSVSESTSANLYRINVHVPFSGEMADREGEVVRKISLTLSNWRGAKVIGIPGIDNAFDVILGMDFICNGALHISGDKFTFCI